MPSPASLPGRLFRFLRRVVSAFFENKGLLLAGGVGYNILLSVLPFLAVAVTVLSYFIDEERILQVAAVEVEALLPTYSHQVMQAVRAFLYSREVVGVVGGVVLVVFSTLAFRMVEEAISVIFRRHGAARERRRSFWFSTMIHYVSLVALTVALLCVTLVQTLGETFLLEAVSTVVVQLVGFFSLFVLFTATYKVMPVVIVSLRRCAIGGLAAAILWKAVGGLLAYYFQNMSLVDVVYGSLATVVILLLTLEVGAIIVLLGAQVIAELERSAHAGVPWYEIPPPKKDEPATTFG